MFLFQSLLLSTWLEIKFVATSIKNYIRFYAIFTSHLWCSRNSINRFNFARKIRTTIIRGFSTTVLSTSVEINSASIVTLNIFQCLIFHFIIKLTRLSEIIVRITTLVSSSKPVGSGRLERPPSPTSI